MMIALVIVIIIIIIINLLPHLFSSPLLLFSHQQ